MVAKLSIMVFLLEIFTTYRFSNMKMHNSALLYEA
ncbi:hypothetical protein FBZ87_10375 [Nitrospirillum amazonense]|uniref:Uncharacterized protein n=1 Tax=Nitrospirillum amazonense TaxID=28077 RepID=A0A560K9C3_9PROT|nr:hypothetical protein FBZ87_10375 [Nitrospirillum amazonense]